MTGFEALLRWRHPEHGFVSPAEFVPLAEESGLIRPLGRWVLETACRHAVHWPAEISVSVNLSPVQFKNTELPAEVEGALAASGLPPERLQLEVTESLLLHDTDSVLGTLTAFRNMGIRISMDDFGTGYSSLGYISKFPFDKIKIDKAFVQAIDSADSLAIVRAVIGLSRALGIEVIAEGVETTGQLEALRREGCHEMQGFHFSRPQPLADLAATLLRIDAGWRDAARPRKAGAAPAGEPDAAVPRAAAGLAS